MFLGEVEHLDRVRHATVVGGRSLCGGCGGISAVFAGLASIFGGRFRWRRRLGWWRRGETKRLFQLLGPGFEPRDAERGVFDDPPIGGGVGIELVAQQLELPPDPGDFDAHLFEGFQLEDVLFTAGAGQLLDAREPGVDVVELLLEARQPSPLHPQLALVLRGRRLATTVEDAPRGAEYRDDGNGDGPMQRHAETPVWPRAYGRGALMSARRLRAQAASL